MVRIPTKPREAKRMVARYFDIGKAVKAVERAIPEIKKATEKIVFEKLPESIRRKIRRTRFPKKKRDFYFQAGAKEVTLIPFPLRKTGELRKALFARPFGTVPLPPYAFRLLRNTFSLGRIMRPIRARRLRWRYRREGPTLFAFQSFPRRSLIKARNWFPETRDLENIVEPIKFSTKSIIEKYLKGEFLKK